MRARRPPAPPDHAGIAFGRHRPRIHPTAFVTEGTYVVGRVTVAARASIWFGAVLRGDFEAIRVGEDSLIEDNVVLHGRVVVGRRCVIGHGAILHGCTVGDGAVIGSNAVVFDGARIGEHALVTAGSVVYPKTRVPARMVFRSAAGSNRAVIEPVGRRRLRWEATSYRSIVAIYRAGGAHAAGEEREARAPAPPPRAGAAATGARRPAARRMGGSR
ncbi:MAG TPA: gamma carbonic anhydrase family protein [Candidatus Binatia bacterium]|nr:gamma carbonic anhydrase family protein [Candidatus Binatia bacterium]